MKNFLFVFAFIVFTALGYSQSSDPVKWATSVEKISDTEYDLVTKATIESGWDLYSQLVSEGGPTATSFIYDDSEGGFTIVGNTTEEAGKTAEDPVFKLKNKIF